MNNSTFKINSMVCNGFSERYEKMNNPTLRIQNSKLSNEWYKNFYGKV